MRDDISFGMRRLYRSAAGRLVSVFMLVLSGLVIRLWGAPASFYWMSDVARDVLVASHIAKYAEFPLVGHTAAGFGDAFFYPPYTYYVLAALSVVAPTPESLIALFVVIHSLSVVVYVYAVSSVFGWPAALLSGLFLTFSSKMVDISRLLLVTPGLPVLYAAAFVGARSVRKGSFGGVLMSVILISYAAMFHYSALLYLPVVWVAWMAVRKRGSYFQALGIPLFSGGLMVLWLLPLIRYFGWHEVMRHFLPGGNFMLSVREGLHHFVRLSYEFWFAIFMKGSVVAAAILIIMMCIIAVRTKHIRAWLRILSLPIVLAYGIAVMSLMKATVADHFFTYFFPLFFAACGVVFATVWRAIPRGRPFTFLYVAIISLFLYVVAGGFAYVQVRQPLGLAQSSAIAVRIGQFIVQQDSVNPDFSRSFRMYVSAYSSPVWATPTAMYFLEHVLNKKLVRVINDHTSIEQLNDDAFVIVVCQYLTAESLSKWNISSAEWNQDICLRKFTNKFPKYASYVISEISGARSDDAHVFLFTRPSY